jgi:hypothetical protein
MLTLVRELAMPKAAASRVPSTRARADADGDGP